MQYEHYRDGREYFRIGSCSCYEHFHRAVELIVALKNEKTVYIDGREYRMREGDVLLVAPFVPHRFPKKEGSVGLCAVLPLEYSDLFSEATGGRMPLEPVFRDPALTEDVRRHLVLLDGTPAPLLKRGIYSYVLSRLIDASSLDMSDGPSDGAFAVRVLSYLEKHCAERLTLESVSAALGYNRCYFSTLFRKNLRMGFHAYLTRMRIGRAQTLLMREPVSAVYRRVGYESPQAFYAAFRRVTGKSPGDAVAEWRRESGETKTDGSR